MLVQKLEVLSGINLAHPFTKPFEASYVYDNEAQCKDIIDNYGTYKTQHVLKQYTEIVDDNKNADEVKDKKQVHITTMYIGLDVAVDGKKQVDIHVPCSDFFNLCRSFSEYDDTDMFSLMIKYVKLHDLPDNVYESGEERPVKHSKRKKQDKDAKKIKRPKSNSLKPEETCDSAGSPNLEAKSNSDALPDKPAVSLVSSTVTAENSSKV